MESCAKTLEMKEELLLIRLVFGFRLLEASLPIIGVKSELISPKIGVLGAGGKAVGPLPSDSCEMDDSSCSLMLHAPMSDIALFGL